MASARPPHYTLAPPNSGPTLGAVLRVAVDSRREDSDTVTLRLMGPISALSMKYLGGDGWDRWAGRVGGAGWAGSEGSVASGGAVSIRVSGPAGIAPAPQLPDPGNMLERIAPGGEVGLAVQNLQAARLLLHHPLDGHCTGGGVGQGAGQAALLQCCSERQAQEGRPSWQASKDSMMG